MRRLLLASFPFVLFACGGASAPAPAAETTATSGEEEESMQLDDSGGAGASPMITGWQSELNDLQSALDSDASQLSSTIQSGRCDDAGELAERICELADRICSIAEEHAEASPRCDDAEERCSRSRERVADECG
ncbi:MAG: hypothetical protein H6722_22465 [Sandaracinus sp.]|nr:hypothetical protein [Myxococcales bacterium]MCB9602028.1 hypothetical protein [Sandaracinus sp.]MCB9615210.1 hypothetical protein [Sandaracinus sp.]